MGKGIHGGFKNTIGRGEKHSLVDNLPNVEKRFALTVDGFFGKPSERKNSKSRIVESPAPVETAYDFFNRLTKGYDIIRVVPQRNKKAKMSIAYMKDKSHVAIRKTSSSDGSPVVEIWVSSPGRVKDQKIHFVKKEP